MLIERAIETFERLGKEFRKEKNELIELNSMLGDEGISSIEIKTIENIDKILMDYSVIIPALKQHLNEGNWVIYSSAYFTHIIERYKNNKNK